MKNEKTLEKKVVPVYSWDSAEKFTDEIVKEDKHIREAVGRNPNYKILLNKITTDTLKKYKGPIYFGKIIDKWDRITSTAGMLAELVPGVGTGASTLEEIPELIPKAVYAVYYVAKTGDWKAIPYWSAAEAASFVPFGIGDMVDWTNIYLNRARKKMKDSVKEKFKEKIEDSDKEDRKAA